MFLFGMLIASLCGHSARRNYHISLWWLYTMCIVVGVHTCGLEVSLFSIPLVVQ